MRAFVKDYIIFLFLDKLIFRIFIFKNIYLNITNIMNRIMNRELFGKIFLVVGSVTLFDIIIYKLETVKNLSIGGQ